MALTNKYRTLDECLHDYTEWYVANQSRVIDPASCVRFLKLAIDGRLFLIHLMREQLVSLRASRTNVTDFDIALDEFTAWYATNTETISDPEMLIKFLKKATDDTLHLIHLLRDQLAEANHRAIRESALWLPTGLRQV